MTPTLRWWRDRGDAERLDAYTRWPLYLFSGSEPLILLGAVTGNRQDPLTSLVLALLATVHTVVCLAVLHRALGHVAPGGPRPGRRLLGVMATLTLTGIVTALALLADDPTAAGAIPPWLVAGQIFWLGAMAAVAPLLRLGALAALSTVPLAAAGVAFATAADTEQATPWVVTTALMAGTVVITYRSSTWYLGIMWELERARVTETELAVAEERLRFARDLHDVLGRNLALIALHSDVAAQLLRRGQEGAPEHLATVHRTAGDSMRELRDVVGGYRTADLDTELAGARSVLGSAGIQVRMSGSAAQLPANAQAAFGWVVREAVTNILRHAEPTVVGIHLDVAAGAEGGGTQRTAVLSVENDGGRAAADVPGTAGAGLTGLRERLARAGGHLRVENGNGGRFRLEASLPLEGGA